METSLADQDHAITILPPDADAGLETDPVVSPRQPATAGRRSASMRASEARPRTARQRSEEAAGVDPQNFYRDLVWSLRNGVLAVTRDGRVAVMNEAAYQILGVKPRAGDIGKPFTAILKDEPDVCRVIAAAFDLSHLPSRV